MSSHFSTENGTKLMEIESFLANNIYLSGEALPNQEDAKILEAIKETPDRSKYPNLFAWWWNLCLFQPAARELWGCKEEKKECKEEKKECKKEEKKCNKPVPTKKVEVEDEDDDVDLFGEVTEEEKQALEAEQKKKEEEKKSKAKVVVAKSRVIFDVKSYEVETDFDNLCARILEAIKKVGLVWQDSYEIIPIGYGIKCLRLTMIIEDDKISADDILEEIKEKWEDEVQSCDIHEFNKV